MRGRLNVRHHSITMATPAIVDGTIYVRTEKNVYAFGLSK